MGNERLSSTVATDISGSGSEEKLLRQHLMLHFDKNMTLELYTASTRSSRSSCHCH